MNQNSKPTVEEERDWKRRAALKEALVPAYWETFATHVTIRCGNCQTRFTRNLIPNEDDPTFICPKESCRKKNSC